MSTEGVQITIPDFDEEEFNSTPIPFGRSGHAFGFGSSGSGQDSPTITTPVATSDRADRSYFHSHNRGDSVASEDSTHSVTTRFTSKPTPFAHTPQSSIGATSTSPFTKKTSFASIRNAFKSAKNSDAPPVPQIDHQAYPVLKNPFNRSTSSLTHVAPMTSRGPISGPITASPPYPRPQTPGSSESRYARGTPSSKAKSHTNVKSHHSQSGSVFHASDGGSDYGSGHPPSSSPPPVPRVPNTFGNFHRSETPPISDIEEEKVVIDPKTPSGYALHAVFMRFATSAEGLIDTFLRQVLENDPLLPDSMGPGIDAKFDETLQSLGKIAQKHAKPVVDSILRWRKGQDENVGSDIIRLHMAQSPGPARAGRVQDVPALLNERKSLAAIYIMCRALIAVLQSISKDALGETMGYRLEDTTFEQFRKPDLKLLTQSANHRTNAELYATLLGHIANVRFVSVTDRFLAELGPVASGQVPKDLDMKYENLVKGLKHVQIKVWPPETFEEGAEFLESLSKSFANAHGLRLKTAFAETLLHLLHPIGKTAQVETNNPQWAKAIEIIYPKAREMMSKPRYWHVAYPLVITSLCVAPQSFFLKHWTACFEGGISKLKEKPYRPPILNGMMRLLWTYLYRCQESASTTTTKLDNLLKYFFPPHRLTIYPYDDNLEPFVYITHFVLSRHFEYGRDLCLDLLQESAINAVQSGNITSVLAPERTAVAIQAILLSLHVIEREELTPTWPSSTDFSTLPLKEDYPSSSDFVPASFLSKPGMQEFFDRCGTILATIAVTCGNAVGHMSIFDDQWSYARLNPAYEESHTFVIRRHTEGTVAYPNHIIPQINMLQTCFQSWPRCLHPALPISEAIDMLLRGIIHVEPQLGAEAYMALKRFMADPSHALTVLSRYAVFLFNPTRITQEISGAKLIVECTQLLNLWVNLVDGWIRNLIQQPRESLSDDEALRCNEIEAGALFLLLHDTWSIHCAGVKIIRLLGLLVVHISPETSVNDVPVTSLRTVQFLHGKGLEKTYLYGYDELLDKPELGRLEQWRQSKRIDIPLRIADSTNEKDRRLWRHLFPAVMQACADQPTQVLASFRESVVAAASRYHPTISHLAGLSSRIPLGLPTRTQILEKDGPKLVRDNKQLIDQWHIWVKVLCSTATLSETSRPALTQLGREHSRAPSDANFERERLSTTRGLFRYLTPFLDSEYTLFRDAAVLCISSFPSSAYPQLLEDLSLLAGRQFYDDPRTKSGTAQIVEQNINLLAARQFHDESRSKSGFPVVVDRTRRQERLHSAVARIYYLTAHCLQHQRSSGRQAALANVLKFVRNTQAFLTAPEMRDNYTLQRLRRYFCGTVERLFDGLSSLKDSDRFIPPNMHLTLYHLCEEWCQFGPQPEAVKQRLISMQRAAASAPQVEPGDSVERFQNETLMLSYAAVGALASLCQKAFFPPDQSSSSPTERPPPEYLKPLSPSAILERLGAVLSSTHLPTQARGKKALKSLLAYNTNDNSLLDESLKRAVLMTQQLDSSHARFFEVISDIICNTESHTFTFSQVVCLGLSNLCHPLLVIRRHAFNMLETIHQQWSGLLAMSQFEPIIGSLAPSTYVHAHRLVSDFLAGEHPHEASHILAQLANWLPQLHEAACNTSVPLLLLQSLEFWIPNIELMKEDKSGLSREGLSALYHLMALTLRYAQSHAEQILVLWTKLVDPPHQSNGHATIRFLLEQSHKVGSTVFISCASNVVACLCQTVVGRQIFEELCTVIEPARMLPTIEHKLAFPDAADMELWSDLDALFAEQPRLSLGSAQFAWLFLADVALQRHWELKAQLPVLLHAIFTHLDHRILFVRQQAQRMLYQLLRSWTSGYDELPDRSNYPSRSELKLSIASLEQEADSMYWKEEETSVESEPKMEWLCSRVLVFMEPLTSRLAERWGSLALTWGTACSIRATAFRSLQIFRALMPRVSQSDLALLFGRLSNTIAAPDENIQSFTSEIILTLNALAALGDLDRSLLPQMFWCACACLSTTVQQEFGQVLKLLDSLLKRVDLDDPSTAELLLSQQPLDWIGSTSLQSALLKGLRSSATSSETIKVLQILAKVDDERFIDPSDGRVRDLYTVSLPWCLHVMATETPNESLREFAESIGRLAKQEGRFSIHKIMTSFAKGHFRTKDDFLRQSVASLREHYGVDHWTEIVTLLLGLVLNSERWLRVQSMQILKVLFQQRETRNPVELLGSELLMPLLRLLETDLAPQALEVLEEPMTMSGGPAAKHVLRMSMHAPTLTKDVDSVAAVFGVPEESGWCVAQADSLREICRHNVMAVFDTCSMPSRPSRIDFEPEVEALADPLEEDLGGLVQNLHELTTFFQEEEPSTVHTPMPLPSRRLEARVAAILAKSTAPDTTTDTPQTPFLDVFRVGGIPVSDDSDEYSDSDSELDAFIFDSPSIYRAAPNGSRYH